MELDRAAPRREVRSVGSIPRPLRASTSGDWGEVTLVRRERLHDNLMHAKRDGKVASGGSRRDPACPASRSRALAIATAAIGVGIVVVAVGGDYEQTQAQDDLVLLAIVLGTVGMGTVGAVLSAKAPRNPLGLAYQVAAMFIGLTILASLYGELGVTSLPDLPFVPIAGWLMQIAFLPAFSATLTVFLLFPDGHPPSSRWRPTCVADLGWRMPWPRSVPPSERRRSSSNRGPSRTRS